MSYIKNKNRGIMPYVAKPFAAILLLFGLFGIVWLRSKIVTVEYAISRLENKKNERLRETKILMAERASVLSLEAVEKATLKNSGFKFPDRTRVVYVKNTGTGPQDVSLRAAQFDLAGKRNEAPGSRGEFR